MAKSKILVADDEPDVVETIQFRLEQEGYEVATASDGAEALEVAPTHQPDLLILDVMMPGENGYRVARKVREDEEAGIYGKKAGIILLTARDLRGDEEREKMFMDFSGADLMLYKPFDLDDLMQRVQELLDRYKKG
jgi:two-component system OmpR family response regulator